MNIYKIALNESIVYNVKNTSETHTSFQDTIFQGNELRKIIPLENHSLVEIFTLLESGLTKSGTKYKISDDKQFVFKLKKDENGNLKTDKNPIKIGKVVFRELGQEYTDILSNEWVRSQENFNENQYSIILSRSPIDIARMSDHKAWESCHSPKRELFIGALQEANNGGAIAYAVNKQELEKMMEKDEDFLQSEDIFEDRDRGIYGLQPVSRLRINKYVSSPDNGGELAVPVHSIYGRSIPGFYNSVKRFLYNEQPQVHDENIDFNKYFRCGGNYRDLNDNVILRSFLEKSTIKSNNLEVITGKTFHDEWEKDIDKITSNFEQQAKNIDIFGLLETEDDLYITAHARIRFYFKSINSFNDRARDFSKFVKRNLNVTISANIEDVDINNGHENMIMVTLTVNPEIPIRHPDDYEEFAEALIDYEEKEYQQDYILMRNYLHNQNAISTQRDIEEYLQEKQIDVDENGNILFPMEIKIDNSIYEYVRDIAYQHILLISNHTLKDACINYLNAIDNQPEQLTFDFYQTRNDNMNHGIFPPNIFIDNYHVRTHDIIMTIVVPSIEFYKIGEKKFNTLINNMPRIATDIRNKIDKYIRVVESDIPKKEIVSKTLNWYR